MDWILFVLIGFATSFVGTLAGGGGLISMPVLLTLGVPIHQAISSAKFSNTISSFSSFFVLFRQQNIRGKQLLLIIPISLGGGATGGAIASLLSERTMTIIAVMLLLFALCLQLFKKSPNQRQQPLLSQKFSIRFCMALASMMACLAPAKPPCSCMLTYAPAWITYRPWR